MITIARYEVAHETGMAGTIAGFSEDNEPIRLKILNSDRICRG